MQNFILNVMMRFVGATDWDNIKPTEGENTPDWIYSILVPILKVLDNLLVPVIIILGVAGMIYAIVIGVQYAKAESSDKRDEAKKRLINAVIGVVIMLVALIGMKIFIMNAPDIFGWVNDSTGV